jgi:hypothetical protein
MNQDRATDLLRKLSSGYRSKILGTLGTNAKTAAKPLPSLRKFVPRKFGDNWF